MLTLLPAGVARVLVLHALALRVQRDLLHHRDCVIPGLQCSITVIVLCESSPLSACATRCSLKPGRQLGALQHAARWAARRLGSYCAFKLSDMQMDM